MKNSEMPVGHYVFVETLEDFTDDDTYLFYNQDSSSEYALVMRFLPHDHPSYIKHLENFSFEVLNTIKVTIKTSEKNTNNTDFVAFFNGYWYLVFQVQCK